MSFLFHKNTKATIKWVWIVIAVIIIFSMVFAYSGGLAGLFA
jgi:hypothetical protein